jgi:hypothetical protein
MVESMVVAWMHGIDIRKKRYGPDFDWARFSPNKDLQSTNDAVGKKDSKTVVQKLAKASFIGAMENNPRLVVLKRGQKRCQTLA